MLSKLRFALFFALALVLVAPAARAQNAKVENQAISLEKKAMDDYLQTDFNKAQDKLEKASRICEGKCSPSIRARIFRDLGVVQIGGAIDKDKGISHFVDALKIDPGISLDADIRTKDLDAAFADAKRRVTGGAAPVEPSGSKKPKPAASGEQPEGDFAHTPVPQQQVRTPIPVYVEFNGEQQLVRVIARYKGFGMAEWRNVELKKMGERGWGGLIPCADVQQGVTQYILTGFDANNDPVATGGDRTNPYKVQVTNDRPADPPHLPNASPPSQCQDTGDCPPNFPGCKKAKIGEAASTSEHGGKEGGEFCEENSECKSGDCESNKCTAFEAESATPKGKRFWIGLAGALDFSFVPSTDDACKLQANTTPQNTSNYYCVDSTGKDYPLRTDTGTQNGSIVTTANHGGDHVAGGGALGNIRLMATFDYAATANIMLGARVGLVLHEYPGDAAGQDGNRWKVPALHAELRFTYVFGRDALWKKGFAPYFMGAVGIAPFETDVSVETIELPSDGSPTKKSVDAWQLGGPFFVSVGGGGRYAVNPRFAFLFGLRANLAFGNAFVPSVGPEVGAQFGF